MLTRRSVRSRVFTCPAFARRGLRVHARGGYTRAWNNAAQREKQKIPAGTGGVAAGKRFMQKTNWSRSLTPSSFRESSLWQLQSDILCGRVPIRPVLK